MTPHQKIIAFDLDGTLAVSKQALPPNMAELLNKLLKEKKVAIISGGMFKQFEKQVISVLLATEAPHLENLILLPTTGNQRYEYDNDEKKWVQTDKVPLSQEIKDKARELLEVVISDPQFDIPSHPTGEIIEDRDTQLSFSALGQLASIEEKKLWDPTQIKRQKIIAYLEPQLPEMNIAMGGTTTVDLVQKGFNKAVGLGRLLQKMGLEKSDMLFVGDGLFPGGNDYSVEEDGIDTIAITPNTPAETAVIITEWIG